MLQTITTLLILATIPQVFGVSNCGPKFPKACYCGRTYYENLLQFVVNCTNAGLHNSSVLEFMPENTEVLIFTGNDIPELPWNVFGTINDYNALTIIDMSNNKIREIRGKSYHHVNQVKRLILNHNNLSISQNDDKTNHHHPRVFSNFLNLEALHLTDAFSDNTTAELSEDLHDIFVNSNLTKLRKLHLEQNEIKHFRDRRIFCDLPSLQDLHLGDNNLLEINFNVSCIKNLRFLDLERNIFEYVDEKDLNLLDKLQARTDRTMKELYVDFGGNPFVCDCHIKTFQNWLTNTAVTVRNKADITCYHDRLSYERIITLRIEPCVKKLESLPMRSSDAHTIILVFLLAVLCFILVGLVSALIYISRERIKYFVSPVLDTVSKKVHYTTIKDEECPEVHV